MIDRSDWIFLARGCDAEIYRKGDKIAKVYSQWENNERYDVLEQYKADTLRARRIINANENKFKGLIKGSYSSNTINVIVLAQGTAIKDNPYPISFGQRFIPGKTMLDMTCHDEFFGDVYTYIEQSIFMTADMINTRLKRDFEIIPWNIKPAYDKENKRLDVVVTDLAKQLRHTYKEMF